MIQVSASEFGEKAIEALRRVHDEGERVLVQGGNGELAVIVSLEDGRLIEEIEDRLDLELAQRALEEPGDNMDWEDFKRELGIA